MCNDDLHDLPLPYIVRLIKSRSIRWVGHMACMGENKNTYGVLCGNLKERDCWKVRGIHGRKTLKWILKKSCSVDWLHLAENRDKCLAVVNMVMNFQVQFLGWLRNC
jgi:hypothetical protein